jgi:hypothetical protein
VTATSDGQIIEGLRIRGSGRRPAILVSGVRGVTIRNVEVLHEGGPGIGISGAPDTRIENVHVENVGVRGEGPAASDAENNIEAYASPDLVITNVRLVRGSSGIYLIESPRAHVQGVEGHDFRGPLPRGQLAQFDKSDDVILEDFSVVNPPDSSWVEDNVSVYRSSNAIIRRGIIDGNNSPSGVGVMFEQSGGEVGGLCEDVHAVRMGNGCFSGYPARGVTFRRTHCAHNICTDQGRGEPLSNGLAWAGSPRNSADLRIEDSTYDGLCADLVWSRTVFSEIDLTERSITMHAPRTTDLCWE